MRGGLNAEQYIPESVVRRYAQKPHECEGDGGGSRRFAPGCTGYVQIGERYLEYLGEAPAYQSGSRHCMKCANAFYRETGGK